jgi:thiamine biosynthesis lipoprotein
VVSTRPSIRSRSRRSLPKLPNTTGFEGIGTHWEIDTASPLPSSVLEAVETRIAEFDRIYSRFRDDSLVARIATAAGTYAFPPDAGPLFALYRELYEATDGAVTPLVGRALETLGYDRAYSLQPSGPARPVPPWDEAFGWDGSQLSVLRPVTVDVGAAGKGYLVDLVAALLRAHGIDDYVVDASGDLVHAGSGSLRVGLEHPLDSSKVIGVFELEGRALCASATNRRTWGTDLHHVIDATTGLPTRNVIATWAIAESALLADGLATALFFAGEKQLARFDFQFVRMFSNGQVERSAQFDGELFL